MCPARTAVAECRLPCVLRDNSQFWETLASNRTRLPLSLAPNYYSACDGADWNEAKFGRDRMVNTCVVEGRSSQCDVIWLELFKPGPISSRLYMTFVHSFVSLSKVIHRSVRFDNELNPVTNMWIESLFIIQPRWCSYLELNKISNSVGRHHYGENYQVC